MAKGSKRINNQIDAPQVYLLGEPNLVDLSVAIQRAKDAGLDLVELNQREGIPFCKIMEYEQKVVIERNVQKTAHYDINMFDDTDEAFDWLMDFQIYHSLRLEECTFVGDKAKLQNLRNFIYSHSLWAQLSWFVIESGKKAKDGNPAEPPKLISKVPPWASGTLSLLNGKLDGATPLGMEFYLKMIESDDILRFVSYPEGYELYNLIAIVTFLEGLDSNMPAVVE